MSDQRLNIVFEQTEFLLAKQKELVKFVEKIYTNLLGLIELEINKNTKDLEDLKAIHANISGHYNNLSADIKEDISFIEEQLAAIAQVKNIQDSAKAEELLNMIVDKDDTLVETQEFKKQVEQDLGNSFKELEHMSQDLSNAIQEGKAKEVRLMLEAVESHEHDLECGCCDDESCDEDCKDSCCDTTSCSSCSGCSGKETDIFEFFKEDEKK